MLLKMLITAAKSLVQGRGTALEHPLETEDRLSRLHGRAGLERHLAILYRDIKVGHENFADLYARCLRHTGTAVTPFNTMQRFQTRLELVQYFLATLALPGARAECGVYRGATALLMCHAWRNRQPEFRGDDLYLIDSYSGTSASVAQDRIPVRDADGPTRMEEFFPAGKTDTSPEIVRGFFGEFPNVNVCAGWIPQVFATLPEREWAFVHLDLSLYEPTLASLEYFYPRLTKGGVILCDGSIFCPGVTQAWEDYCGRHDLSYVLLGHRETVLIK
ncbi:MAG: TylF/MycF family methyltransferase [Betaproteobacteria bacterium]|nr:TylF/MycF family methyltransferase [Betaproteobacteria bacterium]